MKQEKRRRAGNSRPGIGLPPLVKLSMLIVAGFVALVTTCALILPGVTIDRETAESEPGMSVEQTRGSGESGISRQEEASAEESGGTERVTDGDAPPDFVSPEGREALNEEQTSGNDVWESAAAEALEAADADSTPADLVAAVAQSQEGYQAEEDGPSLYSGAMTGDGSESSGSFAAWCIGQAGVSDVFPVVAEDAARWAEALQEQAAEREDTTLWKEDSPAVGDIAFVSSSADGQPDQAGVVTDVRTGLLGNARSLDVVQENEEGQVESVTYRAGDDRLCGYGAVSEESGEEQAAPEDEAGGAAELPQTADGENGVVSGPETAEPDREPEAEDAAVGAEPARDGETEETGPTGLPGSALEALKSTLNGLEAFGSEEESSAEALIPETPVQEALAEEIPLPDQPDPETGALDLLQGVIEGLAGFPLSLEEWNEGGTVLVTACYADGTLPDGTVMTVQTVEPEDYAGAVADAAEQENTRVAAMDISFLLDGEEIQPQGDVKLSFRADFIRAAAEAQILHVDGETGEADVMETTQGGDQLTLVTDSFSVYAIVVTTDGVQALEGKTYGVLRTTGGTSPTGTAMQADAANNNTKLQGKTLTVRVEPVKRTENVYVANNSDISMWTFHFVDDGICLISTTMGEDVKYLRIGSDGITLVDYSDVNDACRITVTPGTGENAGKYKFSSPYGALRQNGTVFERADRNRTNADVWMDLAARSNLNDDDFVVYTAEKVSVSGSVDPVSGNVVYDVNNGDLVVLYTRIWNENTGRYDYYAVDHDGMLVKAYENGGSISWVGSKINTMLWDFTEYYYEGTTAPNYYYELQNTFSYKFIAPQTSGSYFLSDSRIGINLNGRRYNEYYTTVLAWDDSDYDYAALKVQNWQLISAPMSRADTFYFAKMTGEQAEETLSPVSTVDNDDFGITVRMKDYPYQGHYVDGGYRSETQTAILGRYSERDGNAAYSGLLTRNLVDGGEYPRTTAVAAEAGGQAGVSLEALYPENDTLAVNHQFLTGTYNETGYFEYDCTQNFAHLISETSDPWFDQDMPGGGKYQVGDFVIYDQIGTSDLSDKATLKHGQFLPFNDLTEGQYSSQNPTNETDLYGRALSSLDPRKGEALYGISARLPGETGDNTGEADYFFGMEMSAGFMQSKNGLDDWGHDLIFEFSGDDDFWLYVDGMLVLDLGGVHSAIDGSVNFRTGDVRYIDDNKSTKVTTLRALYELAYLEAHPGAQEEEVTEFLNGWFKEGTSVFQDYSGHTMKMFYMERGSQASNLHMRFNLAPYTEGEVLLEKEVTGTENVNMRFPFQIWYKENGVQGPYFDLLSDPGQVTDAQTGEPVPCYPAYSAGGQSYSWVFLLKPGQTVSIKLPDEETVYRITECALNTAVFDTVTANGEQLTEDPAGYGNFTIAESTVAGRKKVIYENHVSDLALKSLTITKRLWQDDEKTEEIHSGSGAGADNTEFRFRIYIGEDGSGDPVIYNTGKYHVKDPDGYYCIYQDGGFVSTGKRVFSDLSTEVPPDEWKSEQEKATFYTSPGGAADKIRAGYSIEVPGLLAGTAFMVQERDGEIPSGYERLGYTLTDGAYSSENPGTETNSGTVSGDGDTVSIHNRPENGQAGGNQSVGWQAVKRDLYSGAPMEGVKFALYRETTAYGTGDPMPYYLPMKGYETLVTDGNGIIPNITPQTADDPNGLAPGTYYLREEGTPSGYISLGMDIRIIISETGEVTLQSAVKPPHSSSWTMDDMPETVAMIERDEETGMMQILVRNTPKNPVAILKLDMATPQKPLENVGFALYRSDQLENGLPKEGERPRISGQTDENGVLLLGGLETGEPISWYLFETGPLDGYLKLSGPVVISIDSAGAVRASLNNAPLAGETVPMTVEGQQVSVLQFTVYNSTGYALPNAGGPGVRTLALAGAALAASAVLGLGWKRRNG